MGIENKRISEEEIQKSESNSDSKEKKEVYKRTIITLYGEGRYSVLRDGAYQTKPMSVDGEFLKWEIAKYLLSKKAVDELNQKYQFDIDRVEVKWDKPDSPTAQEGMYFFDRAGKRRYGIYPKSVDEYIDAERPAISILVEKDASEGFEFDDLKPNWEITHSNQIPDQEPAHRTDADLELEYNK